ncbi:hypothetical protein F2Q68_00038540 [Brassica cretica]|uniref:Uncharacterized protein n=1 Tax=Brassica cretica TaxID=69181 RepID=A0A8S9MAK5_BRACR|nr:hypothetical protein F2Q68_00038540 [Brassica cretica]
MLQRLVFLLIVLLIQSSFLFEISSALQEGKTCILNDNCDAGLHCETCLANNNLRPRCSRTQPINPISKVKGLPFNKYAWLTTHNSFARLGQVSKTGSVILAPTNQQDSVTSQLAVRVLPSKFIANETKLYEYDAVIRSATEPEVNPTPYSTSRGANQDIRALKMPYLTNQEGLNHESNFYGFYTQEGVQANWNWANIFTEQEVMNFTIQRFLNPSICEYPTLEEDSSSIKERPEAKPIIGVKMSLSAFQKAQDQEKWPRKLGVMINSPEPAKPTSSMESLQPIQLGSTQSYLWEPGDHLNQSGGIPEVLSCTRIQEISWFNGESLKPNRSYLWKDWTIFRIITCIPSYRPSDHIFGRSIKLPSTILPSLISSLQQNTESQDTTMADKSRFTRDRPIEL